MHFVSNFGCKITFMWSVNFWHQQDYNSLFKEALVTWPLSARGLLLLKTPLSYAWLLEQHSKPVTYIEAISVECCHVTQFHPRFWYALIFKVLECSRRQSVFPNNSAVLLWNHVIVLDKLYNYLPNYCTLYHLVNSNAQKLNNQVRITFTIFGSRINSRTTGFSGICTCWQLISFVGWSDLCKHLYFFGTMATMSKRKNSSSFQCETDKIIDKAEEKTENSFLEEKNDPWLPNSKPRNFQTKWLNEHNIVFKVFYFSLGSRKTIYWIGQRQCCNKLHSVTCCCLFVPLQRQQRDKLSPEAVELAQTLQM